MNLVVRLIRQYALWIYILCALGMLFYLRAALAARREGTQAMFSLERETAAKKVYRSSGLILMLLAIVVGVYALSHYITIPEFQPILIGTRMPTVEGTLTVLPTAFATSSESTLTVEPTATRRPRTTTVVLPTIVQGTPTLAAVPVSCPHSNVQVLLPGQAQVIDAGIQVVGTANKQEFDRYEFKFQSRDFADNWHWVQTFQTPVENGDLGWWTTSHLPSGSYRFMLIAIDKRGNSQECIVPVVIQH